MDERNGVKIPLDAVLFNDGEARVNGVHLNLDRKDGAA
jgi:hypothetical protein